MGTATTPTKKRSQRRSVPAVTDEQHQNTVVDELAPDMPRVESIDLDLIEPHPKNPREDLGDLTELAGSIKEQGILEPVILVPLEGSGKFPTRYRTVAGHRRCAAARHAGLTHAPALVRHDMTDKEQLEVMVVENGHRTDLNVIEQGHAFQGLLDYGAKRTEIARRTGYTPKIVGQRVKVAGLPQHITARIIEHQMTFAEALEFADLKTTAPDLYTEAIESETPTPEVRVRGALNKAAAAARIEKAIAEWKERGHELRIVEQPHSEPEEGALSVRRQLRMAPAEHAHCPGAVITAHEYWLSNIDSYGNFWCVQPDLHAERLAELESESAAVKSAPAPELTEEQKAVQALNRGLRVAEDDRRRWLDNLFTQPDDDNATARTSLVECAAAHALTMLGGTGDSQNYWLDVTYGRNRDDLVEQDRLDNLSPVDALALYTLTERVNPLVPTDSYLLGETAADPVIGQIVANFLRTIEDAGYPMSAAERQALAAIDEANAVVVDEGTEGGEE